MMEFVDGERICDAAAGPGINRSGGLPSLRLKA
jgi:hypothetical protein